MFTNGQFPSLEEMEREVMALPVNEDYNGDPNSVQEHAEDASGALYELDGAFDEAERLCDVENVFTDIGMVAASIESNTLQHLRLFEAAGQLALAGSGIPVERLMPNLESYVGTNVSLEGVVRNVIETIWEAIRKAAAAIWRWSKEFYYHCFYVVSVQSRRSQVILHKTEALKALRSPDAHRPQKGNIHLGDRHLHALSIADQEGGVPKKAEDVLKIQKLTLDLISSFIDNYSALVLTAGSEFTNAIQSFDVEHVDVSIDKIITSLAKMRITDPNSVSGILKFHDRRITKGNYATKKNAYWYTSGAIPGNKAVYYMNHVKHTEAGAEHYQILDDILHTEFEIGSFNTEKVQPLSGDSKESNMTTFKPDEIRAVALQSHEICKRLIAHRNITSVELPRVGERMDSAGESLVRKMKDHISNHDHDKSGNEKLNQHVGLVLKLIKQYSVWSNQVQSQVEKLASSVAKAANEACDLSLRQYGVGGPGGTTVLGL